MFIFALFGTFYMVTGQNIITGQNRNSSKVLPASDTNFEEEYKRGEDVESSNEPQESKALLEFNEVMSKTTNANSYKLTPLSDSETSVVFYRFGQDGDKNYIAVYGSGLETDKTYYVWLTNEEDSKKLGTLQEIDDTGVLKLGVVTTDVIIDYTTALITVEEEDVDEPTKGNEFQSAEIDLSTESEELETEDEDTEQEDTTEEVDETL
jgi:hypothetical protein